MADTLIKVNGTDCFVRLKPDGGGESQFKSRQGSSYTDNYFILGATSREMANIALRTYCNLYVPSYNDYPVDCVTCTPTAGAFRVFDGVVTYSGDIETEAHWSGSAMTSSEKLLHCLECTGSVHRADSNQPDFGLLVGVDENLVPQGAQVQVPMDSDQCTITYPATSANAAYFASLRAMRPCVNSAPIWGCDAGTILFQGFTYNEEWIPNREGRKLKYYKFTFNFQFSPNVVLTFTDITQTLTKKGHEYVWSFPVKVKQGNQIVTVVDSVYTARFYNEMPFAFFGFNGPG